MIKVYNKICLKEDVIKNTVALGRVHLISEIGSFNDLTLRKLIVDGFLNGS